MSQTHLCAQIPGCDWKPQWYSDTLGKKSKTQLSSGKNSKRKIVFFKLNVLEFILPGFHSLVPKDFQEI